MGSFIIVNVIKGIASIQPNLLMKIPCLEPRRRVFYRIYRKPVYNLHLRNPIANIIWIIGLYSYIEPVVGYAFKLDYSFGFLSPLPLDNITKEDWVFHGGGEFDMAPLKVD